MTTSTCRPISPTPRRRTGRAAAVCCPKGCWNRAWQVDTLGLVLFVLVHAASVQDYAGAERVFNAIDGCCSRLQVVFADHRYAGMLEEWVKRLFSFVLQIVARPKQQRGFQVLPKR